MLSVPAFATDIFVWVEGRDTLTFSDHPPRRPGTEYTCMPSGKWGFELPPDEIRRRALKAQKDREKMEDLARLEAQRKDLDKEEAREHWWRSTMSTEWGQQLVDYSLQRIETRRQKLADEEIKIRGR